MDICRLSLRTLYTLFRRHFSITLLLLFEKKKSLPRLLFRLRPHRPPLWSMTPMCSLLTISWRQCTAVTSSRHIIHNNYFFFWGGGGIASFFWDIFSLIFGLNIWFLRALSHPFPSHFQIFGGSRDNAGNPGNTWAFIFCFVNSVVRISTYGMMGHVNIFKVKRKRKNVSDGKKKRKKRDGDIIMTTMKHKDYEGARFVSPPHKSP